jgi:hypothetical protein
LQFYSPREVRRAASLIQSGSWLTIAVPARIRMRGASGEHRRGDPALLNSLVITTRWPWPPPCLQSLFVIGSHALVDHCAEADLAGAGAAALGNRH